MRKNCGVKVSPRAREWRAYEGQIIRVTFSIRTTVMVA
jgi:hypothetical protein